MKVALCAIAKNEDRYVDSWVKHYLDRGFDNITIYDNNDERDLKCDYPIDIINAHKKPYYQLTAYKDFFDKNKDKYDWIFYFDLDEFLDCSNIKDVIKSLKSGTEQLQFKLIFMSDNNLLYEDYTKSPFDRFTKPSIFQWHTVKSGISTKAKDVVFKSPHYFLADFSTTELSGGKSRQDLLSRFQRGDRYENQKDFGKGVLLHHCDTKTITEYIKYKFARSDAISGKYVSRNIPDRSFFKQNEKTKEKLEILSQAPFNGIKDIFIDKDRYTKDLLDKYRLVYLHGKGEKINDRVFYDNNLKPYQICDVTEFYVEDGIEKRKSLEQLKDFEHAYRF